MYEAPLDGSEIKLRGYRFVDDPIDLRVSVRVEGEFVANYDELAECWHRYAPDEPRGTAWTWTGWQPVKG